MARYAALFSAGSPSGSRGRAPMHVRHATPDDAEAIERIRVETWRATYRGLLPERLIESLQMNPDRRRDRLRATAPEQFCLVAESAGEVIGYAFGGPERSHDADYRGEVYAIYVLPAHQGKGAGRALVRDSVRELAERGRTSLLIWVLRENAIGRAFYERLGGVPAREKPLAEVPGAEDRVEIGYGWSDTAPLR
jgi:ribosomal protein S18 acetylase RimI-like enzyme